MVEVGKEVSWVSQSQGSEKRKTGKVLAIVPIKASAKKLLPDTAKKSHVKFDIDRSLTNERVLVAVPAGKTGAVTHYYCPNMSILLAQGN